MVNASPLLLWSFVALALVLATTFVAGIYVSASASPTSSPHAARNAAIAALGAAGWLGLTFAAAQSGRLSFSTRPPTMAFLLVATAVVAIAIGASRLGRRLATGIPLAALVGVQGFRVVVELILHRAYREGLMPVQMSFSGLNFDILSGLSAIVVALVLLRKPGSLVLVRVWNTAGIILLANILTIALLSAPTPLRVFHNEPANVWITQAPWVWLPSVFVLAAVVGHILVYRRIRYEMRVVSPRVAPALTSSSTLRSLP
jgi:hypothetical protein